MKKSRLYHRLSFLAKSDTDVRDLLAETERTYNEAVHLLSTIVLYMPEYTLHSQVHVDRVIDLMGHLLPESTFEALKPLELSALILAAALHDLGMVASPREVTEMRTGGKESKLYAAYQAFREGYPRIVSRIEQHNLSKNRVTAEELEGYLISEFLRREHGHRCKRMVFERFRDRFRFGDRPFVADLADVCASHTREPSTLNKLPCWSLARSGGDRCNWRFVAVLLRLADILDFDAKRTPRVLFEHLGIRDTVSLKEWRKHLSVSAWDIAPGRIAFSAQCPDPVIEKAVRDFVDCIDSELREVPSVLAGMHDVDNPDLSRQYRLDLPRRVNRDEIGPQRDANGPLYRYMDLDFRLNRDRIMSLVLGVHLYAERSLFLRELLQNAIDACRHRRSIHDRDPALGAYAPAVIVRVISNANGVYVEVEDNGMGMDDRIVEQFFAHVGRSYYNSREFLESRAAQNLDFRPISQFGIGILSTFMAGNPLSIETRRFSDGAKPLAVEVADEGALFWLTEGERQAAGTKITLRLTRPLRELMSTKESSIKESKSSDLELLESAIERLAPHVEFPIRVADGRGARTVKSRWDDDVFDKKTSVATHVDIDLSEKGESGIDGLVRVFLLTDKRSGLFVDRAGDDTDADDEQDRFVAYRHELGYIRADITTILRSGEREYGSAAEVASRGRWSQQGILVPMPLFPTYTMWGQTKPEFSVPFPLPIQYDLNLWGDFVLPLSADRKNVLITEDSVQIGRKLATTLTRLMVQEIGRGRIRRNRAFFEKVLGRVGAPDLTAILDERL